MARLKTKLKQQEFYCVECRKRVKCCADDIRIETDRAGKPRMIGEDKYGHLLFKYIKWDAEDRLARKYN
jgi:hypothetical protein